MSGYKWNPDAEKRAEAKAAKAERARNKARGVKTTPAGRASSPSGSRMTRERTGIHHSGRRGKPRK